MAYATPTDVSHRLGRPLSEDETAQVSTLLNDAEILIQAKIPDLDDKIAADEISSQTVIMVESNAVVRLVRNPNGYTSETDGTYSYGINWKLATGSLTITDHEWSLLGVSSGVFTISVAPGLPLLSGPEGVHPFYWAC